MKTEPLFFDTDCLSAFLWIENECLLIKLYPGRIVIPSPVYQELCHPGVEHLLKRVDCLLARNEAIKRDIELGSNASIMYDNLSHFPLPEAKLIGRGEAACIALAYDTKGVVASNNLSDVKPYIDKYKLQHITTADILAEAIHVGIINLRQAEVLWSEMIRHRKKLPCDDYSSYYEAWCRNHPDFPNSLVANILP